MTTESKGNVKDKKVIQFLNQQLANELTAISQYFLHSRTLNHWGVTKFGKKEYEESLEEMRHADWLIERILFLGGLPNLQKLNPLHIGENVQEILEADLAMERSAMECLREGIAHCESVRDYVSRDLMAKILIAEEAHEDFADTQLSLIARIGIEKFIQLNSEPVIG